MARPVTWLLIVALSTGCGYRLVRTQGDGLGGVRSVAVPTPVNGSYEPGADLIVADALRRELLRRGAVRVVESPDAADLVLSGRVSSVSARTRSFSSVVLALEYELTLVLDLAAERRDGTEIPFDPRVLQGTERFTASADAEALRKNRSEALRRVATAIAGRVADALQESLLR